MRMIIRLAGLCAVALPAFASNASAASTAHDNPPRTLLVEHAELLVVDGPKGQAKAFLTIWNGTDSEVRLSSISSATFRSVLTVSSQLDNGLSQQRRLEDFVAIPSHAELRMQPNGIQLVLSEPISEIKGRQSEPLTLTFDDGKRMEVVAKVVNSRNELVAHHHGQTETDPG